MYDYCLNMVNPEELSNEQSLGKDAYNMNILKHQK